jgi:hypothetical protein
MRSKSAGAVALVILLGLVVGVLGLVQDDLFTVGVLILFIGGVGAAVLVGEYLIRYFGSRQRLLTASLSSQVIRAAPH